MCGVDQSECFLLIFWFMCGSVGGERGQASGAGEPSADVGAGAGELSGGAGEHLQTEESGQYDMQKSTQ